MLTRPKLSICPRLSGSCGEINNVVVIRYQLSDARSIVVTRSTNKKKKGQSVSCWLGGRSTYNSGWSFATTVSQINTKGRHKSVTISLIGAAAAHENTIERSSSSRKPSGSSTVVIPCSLRISLSTSVYAGSWAKILMSSSAHHQVCRVESRARSVLPRVETMLEFSSRIRRCP